MSTEIISESLMNTSCADNLKSLSTLRMMLRHFLISVSIQPSLSQRHQAGQDVMESLSSLTRPMLQGLIFTIMTFGSFWSIQAQGKGYRMFLTT